MGKQLLKELKEKAGALTMEEDLEVIDHLVHKIRTVHGETPPKRKWNEIRGAAPYPLTGEDAQTWVTRTRQESDRQRGN